MLNSTETLFSSIRLYSDSRVTLDWINGNPNQWRTFVANKVIKINENVNSGAWSGPDFLHQGSFIVPSESIECNEGLDVSNEQLVVAMVGELSVSSLPETTTYAELKKKWLGKISLVKVSRWMI